MSINRDLADSAAVPPFRKNLIVNGNFSVAQRGTSFTGLTADTWTLDRWLWQETSDAIVDVRQVATTTVEGQSMYLKMNVTTADTSIGTTQHAMVRYKMEGFDAGAFTWNATDQAVKRDITLSFTAVHTRTGTYCVSIQNSALDRSYIAEYTQTVANTVEKHTITFPAPTDGTWLVGNAVGLYINFIVACGTNFHGAADTWISANDIATNNQVNGLGAVTDNFRIYGVQLETGTEATDFEQRSFGEELALCQRYYEKSFKYSSVPADGNGIATGAPAGIALNSVSIYTSKVAYRVIKRSESPTLTFYRDSNGATAGRWDYYTGTWSTPTSNPAVYAGSDSGFQVNMPGCTTVQYRAHLIAGHWTADAEL